MGGVCICPSRNVVPSTLVPEVTASPVKKSVSCNDIKKFKKGVLFKNNSCEKKKNFQYTVLKPFPSSSKSISSIISRKRSKTTMRRSVFFNRTFINVVIFGPDNSGKKTFFHKFLDNDVSANDFLRGIKKVVFQNRNYNVNLQVAKIENFDVSVPIDFYLIFYDVNDATSFSAGKEMYKKLSDKYVLFTSGVSNIIFVGNKCDLGKSEEKNMVEFCTEHKLTHLEISVLKNINYDELNNKIIETFDTQAFRENTVEHSTAERQTQNNE